MQHKSPNHTVNGRKHNYGYNGVEENYDLGLNLLEMDARHYDPAIGRFMTIDPLAELIQQVDKSSYAFSWNNPIMYNDPSGLCPECPNVEDYKPGDTYDVNGETYVVDQDGEWSRQGGELAEVVIDGSSSSNESTGDTETTEAEDSSEVSEASAGVVGGALVLGEISKDISLGVSVTGGAGATAGVGCLLYTSPSPRD